MVTNFGKFGCFVLVFCFWITFIATSVSAACDFNGYVDYINTWNNRYYTEAQKLYPFGDTYCDQNASSYEELFIGFNPGITFPVYFYGVKYRSIWVSPHGLITLNETLTPPPGGYHYRQTWPNDNYPDGIDPPFLAPFYSDTDFKPLSGSNGEPSAFSWRILDPGDLTPPQNEREIAAGMLAALSREVELSVVGADGFTAEYGLIITWYKVTFSDGRCSMADCVRNTYQLALVVSGTSTYVIYNYYDITWVGGAGSQQCDPITGTRSTSHQNCQAAHIGFNAGYGRHFYALPYSHDVVKTANIDKSSGSQVVGRFLYSVAGDRIVRGGCTNDTTLVNGAWPLEVHPTHTDMVGGRAVEVSGPCFHQSNVERSKCQFGDVTTDPVMRADTTMKARCIPPAMTFVGETQLGLSVDGGISYKYHTQITVNLLGRNAPNAHISAPGQDWLTPALVTVTWSPADVGADTVDVRLMGYKEDSQPGEPVVETWELLENMVESYQNSGSYTFSPESFQCGSGLAPQSYCFQYHVGAVVVSEHRDDPHTPRSLWSRIIPFGWYVRSAMESQHGPDWAAYMCQEWKYKDDRYGGWTDRSTLPPCPCTLQQALVDYGRYLPDVGCHRQGSGEDNCHQNVGAVHCVVSTFTSVTSGSGSRCCYNGASQLMYSADDVYGSRPDRAHEWGKYPYLAPPYIPTLSHWLADVAPWYYCCQWQTGLDQCFNLYMANRRTTDCKVYQPPGHAASFGDPHFSTFDGTTYTFNGHGEFWLLKVDAVQLDGELVDFHLQIRTQQPPPHIWGDVQATITTAVSMKLTHPQTGDTGHTVTFTVDDFYNNSDNKLLVYLDERLLSFSAVEGHTQQFKDFLIYNHDPPDHKASSNFTVAYRHGVGVQVSFHNGLIHTMVAAPPQFKERTLGLLGHWNDDPSDDLIPKGGTAGVPADDMETIHYEFGLTWMIQGSESLFQHIYRANMDYNYYRDETFVPVFIPEPNITTATFSLNNNNYLSSAKGISFRFQAAAALDLCLGEATCEYDYMVTGNELVAMATKASVESLSAVRQMAAKVLTCGWLNVPNSIKKKPYDYLVGSVVIIEGCIEPYKLEGPTSYTCLENQEWDPVVTTICIGPRSSMSPAVITAIVIPVALILALLVFAVFLCALCCHKRRVRGKPTRKAEIDKNYIDDSFSQALPPDNWYKSAGGRVQTQYTPNRSYNSTINNSYEIRNDKNTSLDNYPISTMADPHATKKAPKTSTLTKPSPTDSRQMKTHQASKSKRPKSANLDDSISIESDKDKISIHSETENPYADIPKLPLPPSNNKTNSKAKMIAYPQVSYIPEPNKQEISTTKNKKKEKKVKKPEEALNTSLHNDSVDSGSSFVSDPGKRRAPYRYPNHTTAAKNYPDLVPAHVNSNQRFNPSPSVQRPAIYNPYGKPSPSQRRHPPYVYPGGGKRVNLSHLARSGSESDI